MSNTNEVRQYKYRIFQEVEANIGIGMIVGIGENLTYLIALKYENASEFGKEIGSPNLKPGCCFNIWVNEEDIKKSLNLSITEAKHAIHTGRGRKKAK